MLHNRSHAFEYFPRLPTELRLLIWTYYFESPRIHILHDAKDADTEPEKILLTCTTVDASTNRIVSGCICTNINREARGVAVRLKSREHIQSLTDPVMCETIFNPRWPGGARVKTAGNESVDVDWANDLFYICSQESGYPFMSLVRRPWARKIQKLAVSQPWESPAGPRRFPSPQNHGRRFFQFDCELLAQTMRSLKALREISAVMVPRPKSLELPDIEASRTHYSDTRNLKRDAYGFAAFADYHKQPGVTLDKERDMDTVRVYIALARQLGQLRKLSDVIVRKSVDVDCQRLHDGEYQRWEC